MRIYLSFIPILFLLLSCNNDDDSVENHPNLGNYELVSLTSDLPLDLDYDNIASTDFKSELDIYFSGHNRPKHELQFIKPINSNEWFFYLGLPRDHYYPDLTFIFLRYGTGDYSKSILLKSEIIEIKHVFSDLFVADSTWLVENNYPYPYEVIFNNGNKATIKVKQQFYDIANQKWVVTDLIGVYEKN